MKKRFYSHPPEKLLCTHLKEVGDRCERIISSKKLEEIDGKVLSKVAYLIGISHDFGKYTTFFQERLFNERKRRDDLTHHGLISAIFSYYIVKEYLKKYLKEKSSSYQYKYLPLISYFIVKRHHLDLGNIKSDCNFIDYKQLSELLNIAKQVEDIQEHRDIVEKELKSLIKGQGINISQILDTLNKNFREELSEKRTREKAIRDIKKDSRSFLKEEREEAYYFLITMLLFSVLVDSDKKSAGDVVEITRQDFPDNIVNVYKKVKFLKRKDIDKIRESIYKSALHNISSIDLSSKKVLSITAPTGTGKTLTGLAVALKLRKRLQEEKGITPRIIYSLPFTSIIDQNFNVFEDVLLNTVAGFNEDKSIYLTKHHHLSEFKYMISGVERSVEESLSLIESWDSEIIVTTFVQFFHSVIGYKNKALKKYHNIVNSIIILDEVQNIPLKYWQLISKVLSSMVEHFNCWIILMTATRPLIFEKNRTYELIENYEDYFKNPLLDRVKITFKGEMTLEEFIESLHSWGWEKNSYLFVFNTIKSSIYFYKRLKEIIDKNGNYSFFYLSTNIVPFQRRNTINNIRKNLNEKKKTIIVTTQVIEAGVDIDVEVVLRDIGPLDSIIQVAGRCNRNALNKEKKGEVHVVCLCDEKNENRRYASYIYDSIHLNFSEKMLKELSQRGGLTEREIPQIIEKFFEVVCERKAKNRKILKNLIKLVFSGESTGGGEETVADFRLIEDRNEAPDYDMFIEIDENAKRIWQKYLNLFKEKDPLKRRKKFLCFKNDFYNYIISVPKKYAINFDNKLNMCHISLEELESYYDMETGFKRDGDNIIL